MGGSVDIVTTALNVLTGTIGSSEESSKPSTESKQLRAERKAQEAQLMAQEAAERKRRRSNVTEARERERRRLLAAESGEDSGFTTLINGGAGLLDDPDVPAPQLKEKFGE